MFHVNGQRVGGRHEMSGSATAAVGGRRREALLRHHADREREQRLSAADVDVLQRDRSPAGAGPGRGQVRPPVRRAVRRARPGGGRRRARAARARSRASRCGRPWRARWPAARSCRPTWRASSPATRSRSRGPILERSPVLSDEDLVRVVRTNAMQYALAVAGRERAVGAGLRGAGRHRRRGGGDAAGRQCRRQHLAEHACSGWSRTIAATSRSMPG